MIRALRWTVLCAAILAACVCTAQAQSVFTPGTTIERVLHINNKQVPLPEGSWIVAVDTASDWNDQSIGAFGYLRTVVLFRVVDSRVDTIVEVNTNVLPTTDGWGMTANCSRTDLVLAVNRYRGGWDGSCYFVTHTLLAAEPTPAWRKAQDFAVLNHLRASRVWLTAGFRAADRSDVLDVRFHFSPETRGFSAEGISRWQDSAWMAAKLDSEPRRHAFAHAVSDWTVGYTSLIEGGLKNRLPNKNPIPMPEAVKSSPTAGLVAERMAELELLRQSGAISNQEYKGQVAALNEAGSGSSSEAPDLAVITAVKAVSYRIIVSISHIFVDYYWTGNYVAAGALEVLQITINSTKFYFHELGWAKYMGVPRTDTARVIDFNYIGVNV